MHFNIFPVKEHTQHTVHDHKDNLQREILHCKISRVVVSLIFNSKLKTSPIVYGWLVATVKLGNSHLRLIITHSKHVRWQ